MIALSSVEEWYLLHSLQNCVLRLHSFLSTAKVLAVDDASNRYREIRAIQTMPNEELGSSAVTMLQKRETTQTRS